MISNQSSVEEKLKRNRIYEKMRAKENALFFYQLTYGNIWLQHNFREKMFETFSSVYLLLCCSFLVSLLTRSIDFLSKNNSYTS